MDQATSPVFDSRDAFEACLRALVDRDEKGGYTAPEAVAPLAYIKHSEANRGYARTENEWNQAVATSRGESPSAISIGRSYVPKAGVDLTASRASLPAYAGWLTDHPDTRAAEPRAGNGGMV